MIPTMLTVKQAAGRLACSEDKVLKWIEEGKLRAFNFGTEIKKMYRIPESDLLSLLDELLVRKIRLARKAPPVQPCHSRYLKARRNQVTHVLRIAQ